jgi:serine protease Do
MFLMVIRTRTITAFILTGILALAIQAAEKTTLILKNGNSITGEVLREKPDAYVMDMGFTIITVPSDSVAKRVDADANGAIKKPAAKVDAKAIYHVAAQGLLQERTVKALTKGLGHSVVLVRTPGGLGSGFIIDKNGHIVTNAHVIAGEREITITLFRQTNGVLKKTTIEGVKIVAINPYLDLALLQVDIPKDAGNFGHVYLGASEDAQDGQEVFAIGNPLGLERTVSQGIVSTTRRTFQGQLFVQTTTAINPGNSGGPLFNMRGEVIGVTNMKAGGMTEGLSFAIPADTLKFFLRNRDVFAFDKDNPNTGYHYLPPPRKASKKEADKSKP